jgi:phosphatidylethanolamine-binding protein (PEBP) family uncharacterized protein
VRSVENTLKNQRFIDAKPPNSAHIAAVKYHPKTTKRLNLSQSTDRNELSQRSSSKEANYPSSINQGR